MSTISTTITHGITLATSGTYASPLTITATGYVDNPGSGDAIYGPGTQAWTVVNQGRVFGQVGVDLKAGGSVANIGTITASATGVLIDGAAATVSNAGTIFATGGTSGHTSVGVSLGAGGAVTNAAGGTIGSQYAGVRISGGAGTVTNAGYIGGLPSPSGPEYSESGIQLQAGGTVTNQVGGTIVAVAAVSSYNTAATLTNVGLLSGIDVGVRQFAGGVVINQDGGTIGGFNLAVDIRGAPGYVNNSGYLVGTNGGAINLISGTVVNHASGVIVGSGISIATSGFGFVTVVGAGTVTNAGTILGGAGIYFAAGGIVDNQSGGTIAGTAHTGVYIKGSAGTVVNAGTIVGGATGGVALFAGGVISIAAGGLIDASSRGVSVLGGAGTVTNLGSINGASHVGVALYYGGEIINGSSAATAATISGSLFGVELLFSPGRIVNYGTITGGDGGVNAFKGGTFSNFGLTSAPFVGAYFGTVPATVTNAGTIVATGSSGTGLQLAGGMIDNTGTIAALGPGISLSSTTQITNSGTISGRYGILTSVVTVTNFGVIASTGPAFGSGVAAGSASRVTNYGTISASGSAGTGVSVRLGGFLSNAANGLIIAPAYGVFGSGTLVNSGTVAATGTSGIGVVFSNTLINAGTISGSATAVAFGGGDDLLGLQAGYKFFGGIGGGAGIDTLALLGSATAPLTADYNALGLSGFEKVLFGSGNYARMKVSNTSGTLGVTISGFDATTETIDLTGIGSNGQLTNNDTVNHRVTITGSLGSVTLQLDSSDGTVFATAPDGTGGTNFTIACFCRGTLIRTPLGEVTVENLAIGDRVVTLSGRARRIKWIGRRAYDPRFVRGNRNIVPVRVTADALAAGVPARDLCISPEHALYVDGLFLPARHLVNGVTIRQGAWHGDIEYFHIELDSHDVIFAEGATAETFVAFGGRGMFHNGVEFAALYPNDEPPAWQPYEALLARGKAGLPRVRARLLAYAERLGLVSRDPDLHLLADGNSVPALSVDCGIHRFAVPAGAGKVRLVSRSVVPAETEAHASDRRRLGVPVRRIVLNGAARRVEIGPDCPSLRDGFHAPEGSHRWTDGDAVLPPEWLGGFAGDLTMEVCLAATELHYPVAPRNGRHGGYTGQRTHRRRTAG